MVTNAEHNDKELNRKIAHNEAERQTMSDVRVSAWAILAALLVVGAAVWFAFFMG